MIKLLVVYIKKILLSLLFVEESIFIFLLIIDLDKIPLRLPLVVENISILVSPIIIVIVNEFINRYKNKKFLVPIYRIKGTVPDFGVSLGLVFLTIREFAISYIVANKCDISASNKNFNRIIIFLSLAFIFVLYRYLKTKLKKNLTIWLMTSVLGYSLILFTFLCLQIYIFNKSNNKNIFNIMGIFLLIILIVQIRVPLLGLNDKNFSIFTLSKAFKIFETWLSLVVTSVVILQIFRVELTAYKFPILILSLSGLVTILLYWADLEKIFGDKYFAIIMIIVMSSPSVLYMIYKQNRLIGEIKFTQLMFGVILAIGAVLLLIVGEDSQLINGIGIIRNLTNQERIKIARYRMMISNGTILATFMNASVFNRRDKVVNALFHFFKDSDKAWLNIFFVFGMLIVIIFGSNILTKLEIKAFNRF